MADAAKISALLHEAAETHQLDRDYTAEQPNDPWEDYYARRLAELFGG
jgi:ABC-type transporter lipoprotein component MlaA